MSKINKAAVLNPFNELTANILNYIPRATTSEFGIVAIGSGINVDHLGRIYLDTQEYSDRLSAIEAQAASSLATQKSEVAAAIAQVNLTQSQTITALTLEVNNLKTNLTDAITTTQTDLINRADQLAQNVTNITQQLTQDKAAFTKEIQDALVYLENASSVASALRTPRKIQGIDFDGTKDISLPTFTTQGDGLVPKREGATTTKYLREDGTWVIPPNTTYASLTQANAEAGTSTTANVISAKGLKDAILFHTPIVTNIAGNAGTATKLQTSRTINGVGFNGSTDITLPLASTSVSGTVQLNNTLTSTDAGQALTAAQGKALNDSKLGKTENAVSASKLQTSRTVSLTGGVTGSVSFDGSANASIATTVTGLGAANGIATLDSNGQVPSNQLPSYVDDVLEYPNVAAFPSTGETGKIYVETTGNTTHRWGGTGYIKITSGEVASVAGKTGVVNLTKADVGLPNVDNTADSIKNVATASRLTTARTIGGVSFDGTANISLPGVNTAGNQSTSGNAGSATKLTTARTFTVGRIGKTFDGSDNVTWTPTEILPIATSGQFLKFDGTNWIAAADNNTTYSAMTQAAANTGTDTSSCVITAAVLKEAIQTHAPIQSSVTGNAATASKLQTARNIALSGAVEGSTSFDGSSNVSIKVTIPSAGKPNGFATLDSLGKVSATQMPTYASTVAGRSGNVTLTKADVGLFSVDNTADTSKSVASAAKWTTARTLTIGDSGKSVDGGGNVSWTRSDMGVPRMTTTTSVDIDNAESCIGYVTNPLLGQIDGALYSHVYSDIWKHQIQGDYRTGQIAVRGKNNGTWKAWRTVLDSGNYNDYSPTKTGTGASGSWGISITGNAASASVLQTARTINGTSFNGTANITTANWGTARTLTIGSTGKSVNGSADVAWTADEVLPTGTNGQVLKHNGTSWIAGADSNTTYSAMSATEANAGTATSSHVITAAVLKGAIQTHAPVQTTVTGNAGTATKLQTARTIGGVSFDGSANINLPGVNAAGNQSTTGNAASATKLATARTINGVSFDGTANITVADSTKLPLSGGTMTGNLNANALGVSNNSNSSGLGISLYSGANGGMPDYGLAFSGTATFGTHGSVAGDWATYFTMSGATNRGWIFKSGNGAGGNVASISATGAFTATSILSSGNITAFSDARLKDNIAKIPDALYKLNQLKGVTFTRKDLADKDKRYVGLIAQDVQKVLPEAVAVTEDDIIAVDYNGIIGLLVEAVKELSDRIEMLEG